MLIELTKNVFEIVVPPIIYSYLHGVVKVYTHIKRREKGD